jgi:predicted small secreted protein
MASSRVKKAVLCVLLVTIAVGACGCQTVQGVGRDITWLGEKTAEAFEPAAAETR